MFLRQDAMWMPHYLILFGVNFSPYTPSRTRTDQLLTDELGLASQKIHAKSLWTSRTSNPTFIFSPFKQTWSPILTWPAPARRSSNTKWRSLHPMGDRQLPEASWEKGKAGNGAPAMGRFGSPLAILLVVNQAALNQAAQVPRCKG